MTSKFHSHKLKILLLLFPIIFSFLMLPACGNVRKDRVCIEDSAGLLNNSQEKELNNYLLEYEKQTTVQIALKTVDSLGDASIEEYSNKLFNEWGIGYKETNNGALFVLSVNDGVFRLELGYGLEWCIGQSSSDEIIKKMIPYLREKDYYNGFKIGFDEIIMYTEGFRWKIESADINKMTIDNNAIGKIFSFVPREIRSEEDKIIAVTSNGMEVEIKTTSNMGNLVKQMEAAGSTITGRITGIEPVSVELINVY